MEIKVLKVADDISTLIMLDDVCEGLKPAHVYNSWRDSLEEISRELEARCRPRSMQDTPFGVRVYTFPDEHDADRGHDIIIAKVTELKLRGWW